MDYSEMTDLTNGYGGCSKEYLDYISSEMMTCLFKNNITFGMVKHMETGEEAVALCLVYDKDDFNNKEVHMFAIVDPTIGMHYDSRSVVDAR